MKTTHEILIFKKHDRYEVFIDGESILENAPMNKNHISAKFKQDHEICDSHLRHAIESLGLILKQEIPYILRKLVNTEIKKLKKLLR